MSNNLAQVPMGVGLFPTEPPKLTAEFAQLADELGYQRIYIGDSQLIWRESVVNMTAAILKTSRASIGPGVTNPLTRDLTVTAGTMATLDELSDGRVFLGAGLGDSSLYTMGKKPASVQQMEKAISVIRGLYAGEKVNYEGAEVHLGYPREGRRLPIMLAATGPRMLELVGRAADGVILGAGVSEEYLRYTQERIEAGAAAAGRDLKRDGFQYVIWVPCSISDDGQAAREAVRAHVARQVKLGLPFQLKEEDQAILEKIRAEYDYYEHMAVGTRHAELVPDHIVERFALAGTPSDIRQQVERVLGYGTPVDEIAIIPYAYDPTEKARMIRTFAEQVMAHAQ